VSNDITLIIIAVIAALPGTIAALTSYAALRQSRQVHESVNGLSHELRAAETGKATAEGILVGEEAQRQREAP